MSASDEIELQVPNLRYDITMPFVDGRVPVDGVRLKVGRGVAGTVLPKDSPLITGDFGLVDLNIGNLLQAIEAGWEMVALPVFSKRKPVYTYVFCRSDRGIATPKDLEGKRIGAGRYVSSITVWLRGLLHEHYGVDISTLRWVVWGPDPFPNFDERIRIEPPADPKKSVFDALFDGEVDAIMTDISDGAMFDRLEASPVIKRLFPDYMAEDRRLYRETGIYTPMHIIGMSRKLDRAHPDLAGKLYAALERAKEIAYQDILDDRAGFSVVYLRERLKEQQAEWGDPFVYGITANKNTIDTYFRYTLEQRLIRSAHPYEEVFAAATLDT
ncbi:MAG TPA: hypothetical protein VFC51_05185 [Chloroflexota bacterium]|nr:hypothetical protein [Chloroflexota bacterium]